MLNMDSALVLICFVCACKLAILHLFANIQVSSVFWLNSVKVMANDGTLSVSCLLDPARFTVIEKTNLFKSRGLKTF